MRFIDGGQRLVCYDRDGSENAIIGLESVSIASTLEAISAGSARSRHSQSVLKQGGHVGIFIYGECVLMGLQLLNSPGWKDGMTACHPWSYRCCRHGTTQPTFGRSHRQKSGA